MAPLPLFGGRVNGILDPFETGSIWDPIPVLESGAFAQNAHAVVTSLIDWRETPEAHIFKADLPGLKKEEVKVQVEGKMLEVSGERKKVEVQKGDTWHRVERSQGNFTRRFRLPDDTNVDELKAQVQDGVLTVTIPKLQNAVPQVRRIEIA